MVRFFRDEQTKEFLIAGTGQQHIEVMVSKLKRRYHTEVILKAPKVPYRETIRGQGGRAGPPQEGRAAGTANMATARSRWSRWSAARTLNS